MFTGLRRGEALALRRKDIDLVHKSVTVSKSVSFPGGNQPFVKEPKTEAGVRVVPIAAGLYGPLTEYLASFDGDVVFPYMTKDGAIEDRHMTSATYKNAWTSYCEYTGLNLTAHQLRHGAATIMFEAGVDVQTAQRILGHADVTMTMGVYTELREKQMVKSVKKLDRETAKYMANAAKGV